MGDIQYEGESCRIKKKMLDQYPRVHWRGWSIVMHKWEADFREDHKEFTYSDERRDSQWETVDKCG